MTSVEQAYRIVAANLPSGAPTLVPLAEARGRRLASDVVADRDYPALDVSAMDGIAVASSTSARQFDRAGIAAAGAPRACLASPDGCYEIATGAAVPEGADTVVPVEELNVENGVVKLEPGVSLRAGNHIRERGEDYRKGTVLVAAGTTISAPIVAVLASVGHARVAVVARLRVTVLATGSELVPVETAPKPHQIRSSNLETLTAELSGWGAEVVRAESVDDDAATLRTAMERAIADSDAVVLSGGVSRGRYDLVAGAVEALGATIHFHWVAQKPGRPMLFASAAANADRPEGCAIFGMPGNPQAATIGVRRYLVPAMGSGSPVPATLTEPVRRRTDRTLFQPVSVRVTDDGVVRATPVATTGSGDFAGLARSDGFVQLAPQQNDGERATADAGTVCDCFLWAGEQLRRES